MFIRPDKVEADPKVVARLENGSFVHRRHPGAFNINAVVPPVQFESALIKSCGDTVLKTLHDQAKTLYEKLDHRQPKWTSKMIKKQFDDTLVREINKEAEKFRRDYEKENEASPTDEEVYEFVENKKVSLQDRTSNIVRRTMYIWNPLSYSTKTRCLTYALARFAPDYAVLCRVLNEIRRRNPDFAPESIFDFGSGVGSTIWATEKVWPWSNVAKQQAEMDENDDSTDHRRLYFCVDVSNAMIDLSNSLLRDGNSFDTKMSFDHADIYFRQFLPATNERQYDLVVSAFSLLEIETYEERMRTVLNLWHKTKDYMVIVENGNRYGYTILMEIRDYILAGGREIWRQELKRQLSVFCPDVDHSFINQTFKRKDLSDEEKMNSVKEFLISTTKTSPNSQNLSDLLKKLDEMPSLLPQGHVVAPCPHQMQCPRLRDVLPCKFEQKYLDLQLNRNSSRGDAKTVKFSYLVMRKGKKEDYANSEYEYSEWPRLVQPVRIRDKKALCEMCTKNGFLSEMASTKNNSARHAYHMIKRSDWGDLWPVHMEFTQENFDAMHERQTKFVENLSANNKKTGGNAPENDEDLFDGFDDFEEDSIDEVNDYMENRGKA
uniref:Methyltransferase-like protein 17, mitochondrial n=1 Tax=Romanomermis culicivorax TaxID=13658 RepID=A0A915KQX3_ROMCU